MEISGLEEEWRKENFSVRCTFTLTYGGADYRTSVGYGVEHRLLFSGESRNLQSSYEVEHADFDPEEAGGRYTELNEDQEVERRSEIAGLGDRAKRYRVWAGGAEDGVLADMAHVAVGGNAVVTVQIEAPLPPGGISEGGFTGEEEYRAAVSERFDPPVEELAAHSLTALTG
ncbi:hypothetical protein [Nocardiopsis composta]|uniref:Uncharacterized protein n=1 Tax=Nocardiopsis composta TaxID=157465 RepID=A0A7W8VC46_9ACTN|nr:hypothetical protein [Nocardiopsis composta]MBB5431066.1 hypothetical protein [Nocardiopsis composta]